MNVLSLFAGIGGLELGLERAGMTTVGQVEIDPFCRRVLAKHWPEVPKHDDVRTAVEWWRGEPRPRVDAIAGGFPCQPFSSAGLQLAQADSRWLWPAMAHVIEAIRPTWVIGENVPGLQHLGLDDILADLRGLGYECRAGIISACSLGAPHPRPRLFVVAHAAGQPCDPWRYPDRSPRFSEARPQSTEVGRVVAERSDWWTTEPRMARVANGIPEGLDRATAGGNRVHALGNAVVPQVAEHIGKLIMAAELEAAA